MFTLHPQLANDCIHLGDLALCQALLMNDSQYPWIILVPRRENLRELYQLNADDLAQCQSESVAVSKLIMKHFNGDKLNTGALGNLVPQLHLHHIVRYQNDPAWPKPVWGVLPATPYSTDKLHTISSELSSMFSNAFPGFSLTCSA